MSSASLHQLARAGQVEEARALLLTSSGESGIDVNAMDKLQRTALHLAAWAKQPAVVALLLAQPGCDVHAEAGDHTTALAFAAQSGCDETCRLLLDAGARVDAKAGKKGFTPLMNAAKKGHKAVVELLLARGANALAKTSGDAQTAADLTTDLDIRHAIEAAMDAQAAAAEERRKQQREAVERGKKEEEEGPASASASAGALEEKGPVTASAETGPGGEKRAAADLEGEAAAAGGEVEEGPGSVGKGAEVGAEAPPPPKKKPKPTKVLLSFVDDMEGGDESELL